MFHNLSLQCSLPTCLKYHAKLYLPFVDMAQGDLVVNRFNLYLKSSQRTQGTNEYPVFMLSRALLLSNPFNIFEVTIKQACIPYSWFSVNSSLGNLPNGNTGLLQFNQLQWYISRSYGGTYPSTIYTIYGGSPTSPLTLTIPQGNYTITSLMSAIINEMSLYCINFLGFSEMVPSTFQWTYNRDTMLVNFNFETTSGYVVTIGILPSTVVDGGLAYNLGIGSAIEFGCDGFGNQFPQTYLTAWNMVVGAFSTQSINCAPVTSLMIRSDYLKQNRSVEFVAVSDDLSDILLRVPVQTVGTTFINYDNTTGVTNRLKNQFIDQVSLYLTDNRTYSVLNLNGLDWMCMIEVAEIETHDTRQNMAHQMLKQIDFAQGVPESIQES